MNVSIFLYQNPCLQCLQLFTSAIITVGTMFGSIYIHVFLCDKGDSVVKRTRKERYSAIKDVVVQYCQIQRSIKFEAMCDFVIQHGCTQFSREGMYISHLSMYIKKRCINNMCNRSCWKKSQLTYWRVYQTATTLLSTNP